MDSPTPNTPSSHHYVFRNERYLFFKDWYWYLPEFIKIAITLTNLAGLIFFVKFVIDIFESEGIISCTLFVSLVIYSSMWC